MEFNFNTLYFFYSNNIFDLRFLLDDMIYDVEIEYEFTYSSLLDCKDDEISFEKMRNELNTLHLRETDDCIQFVSDNFIYNEWVKEAFDNYKFAVNFVIEYLKEWGLRLKIGDDDKEYEGYYV